MDSGKFATFNFSPTDWVSTKPEPAPRIENTNRRTSKLELQLYEITPTEGKQYALDYPSAPRGPDLGVKRIAFLGEQLPSSPELFTAWYVRLRLQEQNNIVPDAWFTLRHHDELKQISSYEYSVPFKREQVDENVHRDEVDIGEVFAKTFGARGLILLGVTGFRIRGHVKIARIEIEREDAPRRSMGDAARGIRFGDRVRLQHCETDRYLASLPNVYTHPGGSGGQMVVGRKVADDGETWLIRGPFSSADNYRIGEPVQHGDLIRLIHIGTGKFLHSHRNPAPLTGGDGQHEVTAWGDLNASDGNDDWKVDAGEGATWISNQRFRLQHCLTEWRLHSHSGRSDPVLTAGEQEVTCFKSGDSNDFWIARPVVVSDSDQSPIPEYQPGIANYYPDHVPFGPRSDDQPTADSLGVARHAGLLAQLIAAKQTQLPLSVGLFGDWGSGKSWFMHLVQERIENLCRSATETYCRRVIQIHFNAWHYVDTELWANLVCEIFDQLFAGLGKESDSAKDKAEKLKKEIGKSSAIAEEARRELSAAEALRVTAETNLRKAEQNVRTNRATVVEFFDDLGAILKDDDETSKELQKVSQELGLDQITKSYKELRNAVREMQSMRGRAGAATLAIFSGSGVFWRLFFLAIAFALPILLGWILHKTQILSEVTSSLSQVGAAILLILGWLTHQIRRGTGIVNRLLEIQEKAQKKRSSRPKPTEVLEAETNLEKFRREEESAAHMLKEAEAKVRALECDLHDIVPGRRLLKFLEERSGASDYRAHLGLVSLVRRDFERLGELLRHNPEFKDADQPIIDRVVLYVDDLDRCSADRVIQVLEAVHLLLAFPMFAVIVAVDHRWLESSLSQHYPHLRRKKSYPAVGQIAVPLDYLEKIFQLPFRLDRIQKEGFERLVDIIFPQPSGTAEPIPQASSIDRIPARDTTISQQAKAITEASERDTTELPLSQERLRLEDWERSIFKQFYPLFRTPRAVKRFANTYFLIRVEVQPGEWQEFIGSAHAQGAFRIPMLMLAVSAAFPSIARQWLALVESSNTKSWCPPQSSPANKQLEREWEKLTRALTAMQCETIAPFEVATVQKWVPRVRRYTF